MRPIPAATARQVRARSRALIRSCALGLGLGLFGVAPAGAQSASIAPAPDPDVVCVQVEIAGERAGHLECATQRLQAAVRAARTQAGVPDLTAPDARSADVRVGVSNVAAARQRLGSSFGVSVRAQRPGVAPVSAFGRSR